MKLIVGLGNPGPKYEGTRHNIGFAVVDYLAAAPGVERWRNRFQSQVASATEGSEPILLMKPDTFMNLSGRAVREALDFYKLTAADVLVICDDLALPLGKLRIRAKGSHGGQNGLRNIQELLGTQDFTRLRVGIDAPNEHQDAADYVLGRFKPGERSAVEDAIARAAQAILVWVKEGNEACMNRFNGEPKPDKPKPPKSKPSKPTDEKSDKESPAPANEPKP